LNRIVLIHGLKSSSNSCEYLEQWLKYTTRVHFKTPARASVFAFDAIDVLSKGVDELEINPDNIFRKIRLEVKTSSPLKRKSQTNQILFMTPSFGVWIIGNGLARVANFDLSFAMLVKLRLLSLLCLDNSLETITSS
jgi:hypothetical protein